MHHETPSTSAFTGEKIIRWCVQEKREVYCNSRERNYNRRPVTVSNPFSRTWDFSMCHETVFSLAFRPKKNHPTVFPSACVTFPWPSVVFHGFWVWPFGRRFCGISLCNFSRVESAGFKSFFSALAVSLAALRIFDENGHKSGRQTCSFFWALPGSEALPLCACC